MIAIHKLLSRIKWDKDFGRGRFEIGYFDRVEKEIIRISLPRIISVSGEQGIFQIMDNEGTIHSIPLHRIKEVYKTMN